MTNKHDHNPGNPAGGKGGPANDNGGAATLPWANARPSARTANDNGSEKKARASASKGAIVSLAALGAALNSVDITSLGGRSGKPMLSFKRDGSGTWMYGQKCTVVEDASSWAGNPLTFRWGFICFSDANKVVGERLVPITQPRPDITELPDHGFKWQEQMTVDFKCVDGTDVGVEVVYKPTTIGGIQAVVGLIEAVRDRLNSGQYGDEIVPVVQLEKDSYQHGQYGRVWTPVLTIVDWLSLRGPEPKQAVPPPKPASPPPVEQPRRRRVA
jgi:hypothetical protein